jgi:hypothetical protein
MIARTQVSPERLEQALMLILRKTCGCCENFTTGIGSCYKNGRAADARDGADMVCDSCIAYRALFSDDMMLTG